MRYRNKRGEWITYDRKGRMLEQGDRNGVSFKYLYDPATDLMAGVSDRNGKQLLWYGYDSSGRVTWARDSADSGAGRSVFYAYDSAGRLVRFTDLRGRQRVPGTVYLIIAIQSYNLLKFMWFFAVFA